MDCQSLIHHLPDDWHAKIRDDSVYSNVLDRGFDVEQCLTKLEALKLLYDRLSDIEKDVLAVIAAKIGNRPFREQELISYGKACSDPVVSPAEWLLGLLKLRQKAIVFRIKSGGNVQYMLPRNTFPIWHRVVLNVENMDKPAGRSIKLVLDRTFTHHETFVNQMFRFLVQLSFTKLHKTKQGTWNKRQRSAFEQLLCLDEQVLEYDPFEYILELAASLNIIMLDDEGAQLLNERMEHWLNQPMVQIHRQLYEAFLHRSRLIEDLVTMHVIYWCEAQHNWFCLDDFIRWMNDEPVLHRHVLQNRLAKAEAAFSHWIDKLYTLGWVEAGVEKDSGKRYYRFLIHDSNDAATADELIIKPDFELFLPRSASLFIRWTTEKFAEKKREDVVITYELTKESTVRGLKCGLTIQQWIDQMRPYIKKGIPENVKSTLLEWERIGRTEQSNEKKVERSNRNQKRITIPKRKTNRSSIQIDLTYPELHDIYPGLQEIPAMWLNEMRNYHPSTSKAIVEKALQYRAKIKCETAVHNETAIFVPYWDEQLLNEMPLGKIQLILPGINDENR